MYLFMVGAGASAAVAMRSFRRRERRHNETLDNLDVNIHVNGIRGKSTVTRMIGGVLTTAGEVSDWSEDWKHRDDEFTRILHDLPSDVTIIDLHGMADNSSTEAVSLDTATNKSGSSMDVARRIQRAFGGGAEINGAFNAESNYTVTRHMQRRGHAAVQVELSLALRDPSALNVGYTLDALTDALSTR